MKIVFKKCIAIHRNEKRNPTISEAVYELEAGVREMEGELI